MKKYTYVVLAAALALSACGNQSATVDSETTKTAAESEETTAVDAEKKDDKSETSAGQESETGSEQKEAKYQQLQVGLRVEYEGEWDNQGPIITADCSAIQLQGDGNELLKKTIEEYNEKNWKEVYSIYKENLDYAKDGTFPEGTKLSISREIDLKRADEQVLSFFNSEISYLGGAHGNYYSNGETFDSKTGEALKLTDIVSNIDTVYELVKTQLEEQAEDNMLFDDYETVLRNMFQESDSDTSQLEWALTTEGLEFRFSPYALAPFAAGTLKATVPYAENEALFVDAYRCELERPIRKVEPGEVIELDVNGDGTDEAIWFTTEWSDETYSSTLVLHRTEESADAADAETTFEIRDIYGTCTDGYLLYTEEQEPYLYVEFLSDNDWRHLEICELADFETADGFGHKGNVTSAVYGSFISDSSAFPLYTRLDMLGTYTVEKMYTIGKNGMPVSEDSLYTIVNGAEDWESALQTEREIRVQMHADGSSERVEETLPKGTRFKVRRTDGKSMVEIELEDGRFCDILVERKEGEYLYSIDGISEYEYFQNLPYAG